MQFVHYFREPTNYTLIVNLANDVSKVVTPIGINIYKGNFIFIFYDKTFFFLNYNHYNIMCIIIYLFFLYFLVQKQPQISVIVVPVTFSSIAVIIVVFGIAYYFQNRSRYY